MNFDWLYRGTPGHPLHPPLTDATIGIYTFATVAAVLTKVGIAEEEEAIERGDLAAAAKQQARMWLAPDASPDMRELTTSMTMRSYEQQLPMEDQVRTVWPQPSADERLAEVAVPTLIVVGTADLEDMQAVAEKLAREIPGARLETIEGAGHLPSLERPDELNRLLVDFLR